MRSIPSGKKVLQSMAIILQEFRTSYMTFIDDATNDKYGDHVGEKLSYKGKIRHPGAALVLVTVQGCLHQGK